MTESATTHTAAEDRPSPDAPGKPTTLRELTRRSWGYLLRRTLREFLRDECPDLAAGLTYYGVLAILPGLIALISLLGVFGQGPESVATILGIAAELVPARGLDILRPVLESLTQSSAATLGFVLGLLGALWFVSGYVAAFGRAMNRIYVVREGRPLWKLAPVLLAVTISFGALGFCAVVLLLISGPIAQAIGQALGLGTSVMLAWNIAKWPLLALVVMVAIAMLYYVTPNVRQPRFRWLSPGALLAIVAWLGGSAAFGLYVSNFPRYDAAYGSLGGVIVFLVWLWVSNIALLLGAELDAEVERARELQADIGAERTVQLPPRDTRGSDKEQARHDVDVARARTLRHRHRR